MKKYLFILMTMLVMSCTKNTEDIIPSQDKYEVRFNTLNTQITRAALSEVAINYIYVYVDGEYYAMQDKTSTTFGIITIILEKGNHTIAFVGSEKEVTDCAFTGAMKENTYGKVINIDVNSSTPSQNIILERIVTELALTFNDNLYKAGVTKIELISKFYNKFNPLTLYAVDVEESTKSINVTTSWNKENDGITAPMLCPSNEFTNDITIKLYKGTKLFMTYNMNNTPFEINRVTNISGTWCTSNSGMSITVNKDWKETTNLTLE